MATRIWIGGTSGSENDLSEAANWSLFEIVGASYQWTASASGTNEYYLEASGGGDPGINQPATVNDDGTALTAGGTLGSLSAGEWAWGDNDTLGFSTVYVRLSDGSDPDSSTMTADGVPVGGDDVVFDGRSSTVDATAGLTTLSGVALNTLTIYQSYAGLLGGATSYAEIESATSGCEIGKPSGATAETGSGRIRLNFVGGTNATDVLVHNTATSASDDGQTPLSVLLGNSSSTYRQLNGRGSIAFAKAGETSSVDTITCTGGVLFLGSGVTLGTQLWLSGSRVVNQGSNSPETVVEDGGTYATWGAGTEATLDVRDGGTAEYNSTGTITTLQLAGRFNRSTTEGVTITNASLRPGAAFQVVERGSVTLSNGIDLERCGLEDVDLRVGQHVTISLANLTI